MSRTATYSIVLSALVACGGALGLSKPPATPAPGAPGHNDRSTEPRSAAPRPTIQIAICLDTSGSMGGLITQAQTRIWDIVNTLSQARRDGQQPDVQVALYQYGSATLPSSEGFMTCLLPLSTDLDAVSEKLFALTDNGSAEYCGQVIDEALKQLSWLEPDAGAPVTRHPLRMVVIAGNEEFTQGPVDYRTPAAAAKARGIILNTIYCGPQAEGERTGWLNGAYLGAGAYNTINQDAKLEYVAAPQDAAILKLNEQLNATYLAYGAKGAEYQQRQGEQDAVNVQKSMAGAVSRAASKSSGNYVNDHWDLIDALNQGKVDLAKIATEDLPAVLQPMTIDQRREHIARLRADRARIQAEIQTLSKQRAAWHASRRAGPVHGETFDTAIIKSIREQAERHGFTFGAD